MWKNNNSAFGISGAKRHYMTAIYVNVNRISEMLENQQKPITLTEVAREWFNIEIKSAGIAQGTKNVYEHNVEKEIIPYFNNKMIIALKNKDYTVFINRQIGYFKIK